MLTKLINLSYNVYMIKVFVNEGEDIVFELQDVDKEIALVYLFQGGTIPQDKQLKIKKGENYIYILFSSINNMQYIEVKKKEKPLMDRLYDDLLKIAEDVK